MIAGIRNGGASSAVFRHNDLAAPRAAAGRRADPDAPKLIAFESVYSMDGDIADLAGTVALAKKYGAMTYLDEVHAVGLYGAPARAWPSATACMDEHRHRRGHPGQGIRRHGRLHRRRRGDLDAIRS